jgi:Homocysteine S-methyltransferase
MTSNNVPEVIGLAHAAARVGLPLSVSFTPDSSTRRLLSGQTIKDAIEAIDAQAGDDRPAFYGINCSHPLEFMPAIEPDKWFERVRCLRPNAAMMDKISLCTLGHLEAGDPVELGELMGGLARQYPHIDMWGGCCGTWETTSTRSHGMCAQRGKSRPYRPAVAPNMAASRHDKLERGCLGIGWCAWDFVNIGMKHGASLPRPFFRPRGRMDGGVRAANRPPSVAGCTVRPQYVRPLAKLAARDCAKVGSRSARRH